MHKHKLLIPFSAMLFFYRVLGVTAWYWRTNHGAHPQGGLSPLVSAVTLWALPDPHRHVSYGRCAGLPKWLCCWDFVCADFLPYRDDKYLSRCPGPLVLAVFLPLFYDCPWALDVGLCGGCISWNWAPHPQLGSVFWSAVTCCNDVHVLRKKPLWWEVRTTVIRMEGYTDACPRLHHTEPGHKMNALCRAWRLDEVQTD